MRHDSRFARRTKSIPALDRHASVAAVVPHYLCEEWLAHCLDSLLSQTRPLQRIIVVDDDSAEPPVDIVRRFPGVTLLTASENVGPYRLIQAVVEQTSFDAYLFGYADDWSARERLETLLGEAERSGAELVGSQELRIDCGEAHASQVRYPLDVNAALATQPSAIPLLFRSCLASRSLLQRVGGLAGVRTNGDAEFLRRAMHVAKISNVPEFLYFRRSRGCGQVARDGGYVAAGEDFQQLLWERMRTNATRIAAGSEPDLSPLVRAAPVQLEHLCGPPLNAVATRPSARAVGSPLRAENRAIPGLVQERTPPAPVFVIGAPRASVHLLAWSLSQHPNLSASLDSDWVGRLALSLHTTVTPLLPETTEVEPGMPPIGGPRARPASEIWAEFGETVDRLVAPVPGRRWVDGSPDTVFHVYGLRRLYPHARFIHVVREAADTVESLIAGNASDEAYHTEASALEFWLRASQAGLDAERALGSATVLRVRHRDMVRSPEEVIQRCLEHIGENYWHGCTWPLVSLAAVDPARTAEEAASADDVVHRLEQELLAGADPDFPGHPQDLAKLARDFARQDRGEPVSVEASPTRRLREAIMAAVPRGGVVLVVSRGDDELLDLGDRVAWHVPRAESGEFAGYHPANSDEAIDLLERQRALGAEYLVFPSTAFWWLDFYPEFRQHVERNCRASIHQQGCCRIYALQPIGAASDAGVSLFGEGVHAVPVTPAL